MQQLRSRLLADIQLHLSESPAVVLLGARQVGKTTLARQVASRVKRVAVFDLEIAAGRAALERTRNLTLRDAEGLVVIDEVQRLPSLFATPRSLCDDPKRRATFLLLGSASPELLRGVSESLAGRVQFVTVPGFWLAEVSAAAQDRLWLRGGFPRSFLAESDAAAGRWLKGFRQRFLERDIPNLGIRVAAAMLERFWTMLAHYHGQVWNAAELGRAMGTGPAIERQIALEIAVSIGENRWIKWTGRPTVDRRRPKNSRHLDNSLVLFVSCIPESGTQRRY